MTCTSTCLFTCLIMLCVYELEFRHCATAHLCIKTNTKSNRFTCNMTCAPLQLELQMTHLQVLFHMDSPKGGWPQLDRKCSEPTIWRSELSTSFAKCIIRDLQVGRADFAKRAMCRFASSSQLAELNCNFKVLEISVQVCFFFAIARI